MHPVFKQGSGNLHRLTAAAAHQVVMVALVSAQTIQASPSSTPALSGPAHPTGQMASRWIPPGTNARITARTDRAV